MNFIVILISILLNYALINLLVPPNSQEESYQDKKIGHYFKIKNESKRDLFSLLSVVRGGVQNKASGVGSSKILGASLSTEGSEIFQRIDQDLDYPIELSELGIEGDVFAAIYIDSMGEYHEKLSAFKSSNKLLEIHVRQLLRKIFRQKLRISGPKQGQYSLQFNFETSTTHNSLKRKYSRTDKLEFSRSNYGIANSTDKVVDTTGKIISGISNVFSLLEYLPSVEKNKKLKHQIILKKLKNDKYW